MRRKQRITNKQTRLCSHSTFTDNSGKWFCSDNDSLIDHHEYHEKVSDRRGVRVHVRSRTVRGRWNPEPRDPDTPTRRARAFGSCPPEETLLRLSVAVASSHRKRKGGETIRDASIVL